MDIVQPWWHRFFDAHNAPLLSLRSETEMKASAEMIVAALALETGERVFDQCCGTGVLSKALAEEGLDVIGVDREAAYVEAARERCAGLTCEFFTDDALDFIPASPCDAAVNWYSSFGYSDDDSVNRCMLMRARDALKPGGTFLLEMANADYILSHFQPERKLPSLHISHSIDETRSMFISHWKYALADGSKHETYGESRMYFPADLQMLLKASGFDRIAFRDHGGALPNSESPRLIVTARRSGA